MNKLELKKILKPLIKECIREAIFEEGILSGLITEVVQGLGNTSLSFTPAIQEDTKQSSKQPSRSVIEARKQLNEVKSGLQKATGMKGIFEGITPMSSPKGAQSSQYGALRDKNPSDPGVSIDGLLKMTGGWSHLTK